VAGLRSKAHGVVESHSHHHDGGVVEPPLRNLEGNPRREVPTMGETDKRVDSCLRTMGKCV
jgi:hypothetical protein